MKTYQTPYVNIVTFDDVIATSGYVPGGSSNYGENPTG